MSTEGIIYVSGRLTRGIQEEGARDKKEHGRVSTQRDAGFRLSSHCSFVEKISCFLCALCSGRGTGDLEIKG